MDGAPMLVLILYHLLPISEILYLQHLSCHSLSPRGITLRFVLWRPEDLSSFCGRPDSILIPPLAKTNEHNSKIASIDDVRVALLLQDASHTHGLDILAQVVTEVDLVLAGEYLHHPQYQFLLYLYSAIPNCQPWIIFSLNGFIEAYQLFDGISPPYPAINSYFEYILPYIGFGSIGDDLPTLTKIIRQNRKFLSKNSQCIPHPHGGCEWRRRSHGTKQYLLQDHDSRYLVEYSKSIQNIKTSKRYSVSSIDSSSIPSDPPSEQHSCLQLLGRDGLSVIQSIKRTDTKQLHSSSLLCIVYTTHLNHSSSPPPLQTIVQTWAPHCDGFLAFSDGTDPSLSAISMTQASKMLQDGKKMALEEEIDDVQEPWVESYNRMWNKVQVIWSVIATSGLIDTYDYFFIGGDDVYLVPENLKNLLSRKAKDTFLDQMKPLYLGRQLRVNAFALYNSGGSGYVLNKASVATLYDLLNPVEGFSPCLPHKQSFMEDLFVGRCLYEAGIAPISSLSDFDQLETFHPLSPQDMYHLPSEKDWFHRLALNYTSGSFCCSRESISFHYLSSSEMICVHQLLN